MPSIRRKTPITLLVALLALGGLLPALAAPRVDGAALEGLVLAADLETPASGLQVAVILEGAKEPVAETSTDAKGRFALTGLPAGASLVLLSDAEGQPLAASRIDSREGVTERVTLALPAPGEANVAPGQMGAAGWIATPIGATVTMVAAAVAVAVIVDETVDDDPEPQGDMSPSEPTEE